MVDKMEKASNGIKQEAIRLAWYMRGGVSYETIMQMSYQERSYINEVISENLETTKKSGLPFF
jgi:hypothetical protein